VGSTLKIEASKDLCLSSSEEMKLEDIMIAGEKGIEIKKGLGMCYQGEGMPHRKTKAIYFLKGEDLYTINLRAMVAVNVVLVLTVKGGLYPKLTQK